LRQYPFRFVVHADPAQLAD
jgi:hypothetical protein